MFSSIQKQKKAAHIIITRKNLSRIFFFVFHHPESVPISLPSTFSIYIYARSMSSVLHERTMRRISGDRLTYLKKQKNASKGITRRVGKQSETPFVTYSTTTRRSRQCSPDRQHTKTDPSKSEARQRIQTFINWHLSRLRTASR